ncbi:MAG TPA: hypothetical protein DCS82_12325 [Rhodospirillaceae bacterium]|nr:hypothetical protein [Rhodospirillaceae bacterium]HAT36494.1 hypothetical protein [Rhodospirillaceae bacterium]
MFAERIEPHHAASPQSRQYPLPCIESISRLIQEFQKQTLPTGKNTCNLSARGFLILRIHVTGQSLETA